MTPAQGKRAAVETLVGTLVFTMIWALVLNAVLNVFHTGSVKELVGYDLYSHFAVFAIGAAVVWVLILLVLAVTGRLWLTCGLALALTVLIGIVDRTKLGLRREPVYPSDADFLRSPGFLFQMVAPWKVILGLVALVALAAAVMWLGRIPAKTFRPIRRQAMPRFWWLLGGARVIVGLVCVLALGYVGQFNQPGNRVRAALEDHGVSWVFWYQKLNYERNQFVPGLLYNLSGPAMKEPPGYGRQTMEAIAHRYERAAARMNRSRHASLSHVNVVFVLSEAFSDPTLIRGAHVDGDPIPFTRALMRRTTSGTMLAQLFGGGTANMEFEALTGQSLSQLEPQVDTPYQQFVYKYATYPSVVGYMHAHGHVALAIHPYMTSMYKRNKVYASFGFDRFIHDTTMHETRRIDDNPFISDRSAFDEVVRQVKSHPKPLFVNLVTMQNHYPMADLYKNPWPVSGVSGALKAELAGYSRGINYTDRALRHLLAALSETGEKTAVVFYGDHLPAFWSDRIYQENGDPAMKSTPYFIWTNFPTPKLATPALTSPIYFMPMLMRQLGAKVPPYYALLTEMQKQLPAMEQGIRYDANGTPIAPASLTSKARRLLHDYRMVQYDLSVGGRYSQPSMFYPAATD